MANTITAVVATYFNNGNTSPQYCVTGVTPALSIAKVVGGINRFNSSPATSTIATIGYIFLPQNQKTTFPSLPGKTNYPRFP